MDVLLSKGFEVEMYTGTPAGDAVGFSDKIVAALPGFVVEPDRRNVEYTTAPLQCYERLLCALVQPRQRLRQFLHQLGSYTLLPGSTLALGGTDYFDRSDPTNPYHTYIEHTYGTLVVTASIHINIGLPDADAIFRACRLLRAEAGLYLALSASSPFLNGAITGSHSSRWQLFPKTPAHIPFFHDHLHYIRWMRDQIMQGTMQNVRHLWDSVRPNGPSRPYDLNRVELRICDLVGDPLVLLAITALIEARLHQMLHDPEGLDPLHSPFTPEELVEISNQNEQAAAQSSLKAHLIHWQTGQTLTAADWIEQQLTEAWRKIHPAGFSCFLAPLQQVLSEGNEAQRWLRQIDQGMDVKQVYQAAIQSLELHEAHLQEMICQQAVV